MNTVTYTASVMAYKYLTSKLLYTYTLQSIYYSALEMTVLKYKVIKGKVENEDRFQHKEAEAVSVPVLVVSLLLLLLFCYCCCCCCFKHLNEKRVYCILFLDFFCCFCCWCVVQATSEIPLHARKKEIKVFTH
jgi:Ca2+/Na+ antiporter